MQGTIYKRVKHQCAKGQPQWVRLPNPTPKVLPCSNCGRNLTTEKDVRYDACGSRIPYQAAAGN